MDIITELSSRFATRHFDDRVPHHKHLLAETDKVLMTIDNPLDKIKFINTIIEKTNFYFGKHQTECKNPKECEQPYEHGMAIYFLTQELNRLGVHINEDVFTDTEKQTTEKKIDQILKDVDKLKAGQEVIYEDLLKELNELRELYFLGKKKWYQLFVGKTVDMVASGVISETISKQIVDKLKESLPKLIG